MTSHAVSGHTSELDGWSWGWLSVRVGGGCENWSVHMHTYASAIAE